MHYDLQTNHHKTKSIDEKREHKQNTSQKEKQCQFNGKAGGREV